MIFYGNIQKLNPIQINLKLWEWNEENALVAAQRITIPAGAVYCDQMCRRREI